MTNADHGEHATDQRDARPDWLAMQPAEFDTQLPLVQGALFAEPDRMGTPTLFGGMFGEDL